MVLIIVSSVCMFFFAGWFMKTRMTGYSKKDVILKTIASFLCVLIAWFCFLRFTVYYGFFPQGPWIILGEIFGAAGDIMLGLGHIKKDREPVFVGAGALSFVLGHLCYIAGLAKSYAGSLLYWVIPIAVGILCGIGFVIIGKKRKLHFGRFLPFVLIYSIILATCFAISVGLLIWTELTSLSLWLLSIGMLLFVLSDLFLSRRYFGKGGSAFTDVIVNHTTYYLAQYLIAISILFYLV